MKLTPQVSTDTSTIHLLRNRTAYLINGSFFFGCWCMSNTKRSSVLLRNGILEMAQTFKTSELTRHFMIAINEQIFMTDSKIDSRAYLKIIVAILFWENIQKISYKLLTITLKLKAQHNEGNYYYFGWFFEVKLPDPYFSLKFVLRRTLWISTRGRTSKSVWQQWIENFELCLKKTLSISKKIINWHQFRF
jgi:hypothetical protein